MDAFSQELLTYLAPRPCRSCGSRCREACTWWRCAVSEAEVGCAGSTCAWWRSPGRWCLLARDNRVTPSKCCRGVALRSLPSTLRDPPLINNNNIYAARTVMLSSKNALQKYREAFHMWIMHVTEILFLVSLRRQKTHGYTLHEQLTNSHLQRTSQELKFLIVKWRKWNRGKCSYNVLLYCSTCKVQTCTSRI